MNVSFATFDIVYYVNKMILEIFKNYIVFRCKLLLLVCNSCSQRCISILLLGNVCVGGGGNLKENIIIQGIQ